MTRLHKFSVLASLDFRDIQIYACKKPNSYPCTLKILAYCSAVKAK